MSSQSVDKPKGPGGETTRRGPGRPVSRVRREEKANNQDYRTVLVEPYMHRDLKRVAAILNRPMRELLEEAFYLHPSVADMLPKLEPLK